MKNKTIAFKIRMAMITCSIACLAVLGIISITSSVISIKSTVKNSMNELVHVSAELVAREVSAMKQVPYELGCNPILASDTASNEEKIAILQQKVRQYDYTGCGLTMADNIDIVSGWDCTTQDTVVRALAGDTYFSEPKIKNGGPLCSYFSAPLWKDGNPESVIIGSVIFMSNDHFLQDIVHGVAAGGSYIVYLLDQHGNIVADSSVDQLTEIINPMELANEDKSYQSFAKINEKMVAQEQGFTSISLNGANHYISYAPVDGTEGWSVAIATKKTDYIMPTIISIALMVVVIGASIFASIKSAKRLGNLVSTPISNSVADLVTLSKGDLASKNLNCKIDKFVSDILENFIEETGLSKTVTVEKALQMYIEQYRKTGRI